MFIDLIATSKVCPKCGIEKDASCFYKNKTRKDNLSYSCKDCGRQYKLLNIEKTKGYSRVFYIKNKEKITKYAQQYRETQKEKVLDSHLKYQINNKEKIKLRKQKYKEKNKDKIKYYEATRKAKKIKATPSWADNYAIIGIYKLATLFSMNGIMLHVDHIVPLISPFVCGLHCEDNLQLLSATENLSKSNRYWPDMW